MSKLRFNTTLLFLLGLSAHTALYADTRYNAAPHYAKVIKADPVFRTVKSRVPQEHCWIERVEQTRRTQHASATPSLVGGIIGGTVGNALGKKHGHRQTATVVGALLGLSVGADMARNRRAPYHREISYQDVERCQTRYKMHKERELIGYDVSYSYLGETYHTRTQNKPGKHIPIIVEVRPLAGL